MANAKTNAALAPLKQAAAALQQAIAALEGAGFELAGEAALRVADPVTAYGLPPHVRPPQGVRGLPPGELNRRAQQWRAVKGVAAARASAQGHDMSRFTHVDKLNDTKAQAICRLCGRDVIAMREEATVTGSATEQRCSG